MSKQLGEKSAWLALRVSEDSLVGRCRVAGERELSDGGGN